MKTCKLCGIEKEYEEFPRHKSYKDGYYSRCKKCNYALEKKWRQENQDKKREIRTRYRSKSREKIREQDREFYKAHKEKRKEYQLKDAHENRHKQECYIQYRKAIRDGILVRSSVCQICSAENCKIDGHHHDYSKPLDVIWICKGCHMKIHHSTSNHAERLSVKTPKGEATVRTREETSRGESEAVFPPSKWGQ